MGLSSSQGRLLMLTSRLSDIELQQMLISQRQNQLAAAGQKAAEEYNAALSNCKIIIKVPSDTEKVGYSKENLSYKTMTQMGYLPTNADGSIYLNPKKSANEIELENLYKQFDVATTDEEKAAIREQIDTKKAEVEEENKTRKPSDRWEIPTNSEGKPLLTINDENGKAIINGAEYDILDGSAYLENSTILQNMIVNGMIFINNTTNNKTGISMELLESNTEMLYELDTSDDAAAQSKYEYQLADVERKENQLELEMAQLETQHEAVLKEYESVKNVISNNVDRTFKLFSDG